MRNFNKKRIMKCVLFVAILMVVNAVLNYVFIPYGYISVDYHNAYTQDYETVYVGTSHGKCGIVPDVIDEITGTNSINMCLGGEYLSSTYYMVKDICTDHTPDKIVYELDYSYWITKEYRGTDSALIYQEMRPSYVKAEFFADVYLPEDYRISLCPWYLFRKDYKNIRANISNKINGYDDEYNTDVFINDCQSYENGGFIRRNAVSEEGMTWNGYMAWNREDVTDDAIKYFDELVELCDDKGIELCVVITPVADKVLEKYSEEYLDCDEYFKNMMEEYGVEYYNFNYLETPGFDKNISSFCDYEGHMNGEAAADFSSVLAEYIR